MTVSRVVIGHHHFTKSSHCRFPLVEKTNLRRMAEQLRHGRESRSIRSICLRLHQDLYQELQGENNGPVVRHDALQLQPSDVMVFFLWFLRCFVNFLSDTVMVFQVCFVKLNKNSLAHSFVHVERGYSEMHVFKCRSCFRYSEIPIFVSKNYFFLTPFS